VTFDTVILIAVFVLQAILIALLMFRRAYKQLPIFTTWVVWSIVSDLLGEIIRTRSSTDAYANFFQYELIFDSILQFGVLVEMAWSVLRPLRSALPRWSVFAIALLILLAGAAVWPIAGFTIMHDLPPQYHFLLRLQQTFSILRVLFFVALAAGSQLLSLGWRDRELQIATGLGFYSLVSLAVSLLHAQMPAVAHYHRVDQLMPASYLCSLVYWAVCFVQKEAPRQEFSPEMRSFLLKVSGAARAGRIALQDGTLSDSGPR
jgi:hypothetical protein